MYTRKMLDWAQLEKLHHHHVQGPCVDKGVWTPHLSLFACLFKRYLSAVFQKK